MSSPQLLPRARAWLVHTLLILVALGASSAWAQQDPPGRVGRLANLQGSVHRQAALATAATIAMQVHVGRARVAVHNKAYRDAERFAAMQRQLSSQVRATVEVGRTGSQALTRERLATLLAEVRSIVAFADLDSAAMGYAVAKGEEPGTRHDVVSATVVNFVPRAQPQLGGAAQ